MTIAMGWVNDGGADVSNGALIKRRRARLRRQRNAGA